MPRPKCGAMFIVMSTKPPQAHAALGVAQGPRDGPQDAGGDLQRSGVVVGRERARLPDVQPRAVPVHAPGVAHDQQAVEGALQGGPAAHPGGDAGAVQQDGGFAAVTVSQRFGRRVPRVRAHPSSEGCRPSSTKPSTDHVLMNSPRCLRGQASWVSRSATWITLTSSRRASAAQAWRVAGAPGRCCRIPASPPGPRTIPACATDPCGSLQAPAVTVPQGREPEGRRRPYFTPAHSSVRPEHSISASTSVR